MRAAALGLARSFQITSLFLDLSVLDNVALAVQAHAGHSFRFWRDARAEKDLREPALAALARVGLTDRAGRVTSALSHGEHRLIELAMALAGQPRMLLLDEPMAGLGPEGSARMVETAARLEEGADHPPGRARHGGGVRARQPHHRFGLWPGDRHRRAGRHPQQRRRAQAYLGEAEATGHG